MNIEYKIKFENGSVTITQHVDSTVPSSNGSTAQAADLITSGLGTSFEASKAAAQGMAVGGNAAGDPGKGGNAAGDPGKGGNAAGDLGKGGAAPTQGQIVVFGPIVIDAMGRIHEVLTEQSSKQAEEEKRHGDPAASGR